MSPIIGAMTVDDLSGPSLDLFVARALGRSEDRAFRPSSDWSQGGPILETEGIGFHMHDGAWRAAIESQPTRYSFGQTPLIAAMRCLVRAQFGDDLDVG